MGHFIEGQWQPGYYNSDSRGHFIRPATTFRDSVAADEVAPGRFHLYVSLACPWAHRTLLARSLLGLQEMISVTVVDWLLDDNGWAFNPHRPGCGSDPVEDAHFLRQLYVRADPVYTGRVTVPVLWDLQRHRIVNNESREILRQLATVFDPRKTLSPEALRPHIDATLDAIYQPINNGVYRCGFAATQVAYDEAAHDLYQALDHWEQVLAEQPFLCGNVLTEADLCLFTTLLRFDPVYSVHFKCSRRRILDYPHLSRYLRCLYQWPGVAETCDFDHIRNHYYQSHRHLNPTGIVAESPTFDLRAPHGRLERFGLSTALPQAAAAP